MPQRRRGALAAAVAAAGFACALPSAQALSLGRAQVQSTLGEAMRAEIEFEALNADEAETLRASVASAETYRLSGVDFNPALSGARVVLQRVAGRRPTLRVTSERAIQEPFLDLVIELNWRGGRLVRSYTLLFDLPPSTRQVATPAALGSAPPAPGAFPSGLAPAPRPPGPITAAPAPALDLGARRGPPPPGAPPAPALIPDPYRVRPGDTLSELAQRGPRPAGVSLDRLVLALYRDNPGAFLDGNIHRLRNGVVLSAPSPASIEAATDAEARRVIRAQSADFNRYRSQLAARPAERADGADDAADGRRASGRLEAAVEDRRQAVASAPDRLTLTKPNAASAAEAEAASRRRERQEAAAREAELSRNVRDLGRLSGAVSSAPAGASVPVPGATGPGSAGLPLPAPVPGGAVTPPPAPAPEPAGTISPAPGASPAGEGGAAAPVPPMADAASDAASAGASAAVPQPGAASAVVPAASAPRIRPPAPPAEPEPGFMQSLLRDNPLAVGLAAALLVLVIGVAALRLLRRRRDEPPETSFLESRLKADSFFGASGGQRVDTREAGATDAPANTSSMMSYSLSQLDAIGDVDPVAEADVYLAYGRDLQAEEILKEALRTTPDRLAIRTKLLEIYARRRDVKGFEELARDLHAATGGQGEEWAKAAEMGRALDPGNPLYDGTASAADAPGGASTLPQSDSELPQGGAPSSSFDLDLDLDLSLDDLANQPTVPIDTDATVMAPAPARPAVVPAPAPYVPAAEDMVTFVPPTGFGSPEALQVPPAPVPAPPTAPAPQPAAAATHVGPPPFNASTFSLDLDLPEPSGLSAGPSMLPPIEGYETPRDSQIDVPLDESDPLLRKLELADEFRQIGDLEGARDLLQEVIDGSDGAVKAKAEAMLARLG